MSHLPSQAAAEAREQIFDAVRANPDGIRTMLGVPSAEEVAQLAQAEVAQEDRLAAIEKRLSEIGRTIEDLLANKKLK